MVRTIMVASLSLLLGVGGTLGVQHLTMGVQVTQSVAVRCPDPVEPTAPEQEAIDKAMRPMDLDYVPHGQLHPLAAPQREERQ